MSTNFSIKLLGGALLLLNASLSADAAFLSPEQSLRRAESSSTVRKMPGTAQFSLAHTQKTEGESYLYVFNKGNNGFIITSADDRMPAVLGYSDNGAFYETEAAPALKWWLSQYAKQANAYLKTNATTNYKSSANRAPAGGAVEPLLETKWNQREPYNLDCPTDAGGQCVTGCVATAMAQVIKYHGYPTKGTGKHTIDDTNYSFDYNTAFDYENMLDIYDSSATEAQKAAVANLMYACGVGVNMNYGSTESVASDAYVPYALTEYFNYDKSIQYLKRDYYTAEEWDDIVYKEVSSGRPVIYGGQAKDGGHEFVCDGYDENGMFHINWGWGGYQDGYFALSALNPDRQGIGGYEGGYNSDQDIICGIKPNNGGKQTTYPLFATGSLELNDRLSNEVVQIGINNGGIYNYSPADINASIFLKAVSATGEEYISQSGTNLEFQACQGIHVNGYTAISLYLPSAKAGEKLVEGEYKLYIVYQNAEGNFLPMPIPCGCTNYIDMYVDKDGYISFSKADPEEQATIVVTELYPLTTIILGESTDFQISYQNNSNVHYSGKLYIKTFNTESETALYNLSLTISLAPGLSQSGTFKMTYNNLPEGEYSIKCFDNNNEPCSDVFTINITQPTIEPTGVTLSSERETIPVGETLNLTAIVTPEDVTDKTVTWTSSNPEVATVEDGKVTAVAIGTAMITATTSNGLKATCEVTVKAIEATGISFDATEKTLGVDGSFTLNVTFDPETTTDKTLTWTSSNPEVATVVDGKVTAVAVGETIITAETENGKKATCNVTVKEDIVNATGISIDILEKTLTEGDSFTITATIDPETVTDKTVTWKSSDEKVATVENGVVTAIAPGTAEITASTSNGLEATCKVTVEAKVIEATEISLNVTEATIIEGEEIELNVIFVPENTTDKTIKWTSSDENVATVENGVVTAIAPGTAVITATTVNGLKATCNVTVEAKVIEATKITLDVTEATIIEGEEIELNVIFVPENTTDKTIKWTSSDENVATVENGVVTAIAPGTAVITATTANDLKATCEVTVEAKVIEATEISLNITEATIIEGEDLELNVIIVPEDATDKTITWASSNEKVATVKDGVVIAVAPGTAVITATTVNDLSATCKVTVEAKTIEATKISLNVTEAEITEGETLELEVVFDPENTTDKTITWTSSNEKVATVKDGVVTAVAPGAAVITATTANDLKATCDVTVEAKVIEATEISLDITKATITEGETLELNVIFVPENTTDKTITWTSSNEKVATVKDGVVTAIAPGSAVIAATTVNGLKATCDVTVEAKTILPTEISLSATEETLTEGEALILIATVNPETATYKTVIWTSSNPEVATVEDGLVIAVAPGTAVITASTVNGLTASCTVTVEEKFVLATSISLDITSIDAVVGNQVPLVATVLPDDATNKTVAWSSSDESVATVDQEGNVTIVSNGFAVITAETTDGSDLYAECLISGVSAAQTLIIEKGNADIYSLDGILIRKNADAEYVANLARGTYILRTANKVIKIVK